MVPLITAIGASLFLESLPQQRGLFGKREEVFPAGLIANSLGGAESRSMPIRLGPVTIDRLDVLVLAVTTVLLLALFLSSARRGSAWRCGR